MAFVESPRRASLKHIEPHDKAFLIGEEKLVPQHRSADSAALEIGIQVEVLQPMTVISRAKCDGSRERASDLNDPSAGGVETVVQPLPYTLRVVATESLQVILKDGGPQLGDGSDVIRCRGA